VAKKRKLNYIQERNKWYAKLKKEGFKDIESLRGQTKVDESDRIGRNTFTRLPQGAASENKLTVLPGADTSKNRRERFKTAYIVHKAKEDYYYMTEQFLNSYDFESGLEKVIWEYHSNGMSKRNITKTLLGVKIKINSTKVWQIINKLSKIMKIEFGVK